jgi:hypothetical protein
LLENFALTVATFIRVLSESFGEGFNAGNGLSLCILIIYGEIAGKMLMEECECKGDGSVVAGRSGEVVLSKKCSDVGEFGISVGVGSCQYGGGGALSCPLASGYLAKADRRIHHGGFRTSVGALGEGYILPAAWRRQRGI